jgi:hypothetical protein
MKYRKDEDSCRYIKIISLGFGNQVLSKNRRNDEGSNT